MLVFIEQIQAFFVAVLEMGIVCGSNSYHTSSFYLLSQARQVRSVVCVGVISRGQADRPTDRVLLRSSMCGCIHIAARELDRRRAGRVSFIASALPAARSTDFSRIRRHTANAAAAAVKGDKATKGEGFSRNLNALESKWNASAAGLPDYFSPTGQIQVQNRPESARPPNFSAK